MKRLMCLTMAVAMTMGAVCLVGCGDDDDNGKKHDAPTLALKNGDIKAVHEIESACRSSWMWRLPPELPISR